ncbi:MAG: hypothetical protein HY609_05585 [Deltaproteobacteria bacterium]|nr:hypothetical protein [Deltaproteobacteria bacterium]
MSAVAGRERPREVCDPASTCCLEPAPSDSSYETVKPKSGFWKEAAVRFAHILVGGPLFGCAYTPPFQPKDDYARYPGYEKDIALHNIAGILKDTCSEYSVNERGIHCSFLHCMDDMLNIQGYCQPTGCCSRHEEFTTQFTWDEAGPITLSGERGVCVDIAGINNGTACDFHIRAKIRNPFVPAKKTAEALKKAIEQYLQHR